jgi:hypothetical protein
LLRGRAALRGRGRRSGSGGGRRAEAGVGGARVRAALRGGDNGECGLESERERGNEPRGMTADP